MRKNLELSDASGGGANKPTRKGALLDLVLTNKEGDWWRM